MFESPPFGRRGLSGATSVRTVTAALLLGVAACDSPLDPALALVLSQPSVEFQAVRGSATPLTRTINISNTGGGRLGPVTCTPQPAAWLTCAVAGGNVLTLTANPAGMTTSPQDAIVEISASGEADAVQLVVGLDIVEPVLSLNGSTAEFTATEGGTSTNPSQRVLTVTNTGPGGFGALGAISCVPNPVNSRINCSVDQGTGALTVSVSPNGLAPGTYVFPIGVSSANSTITESFAVALTVGELPRIQLSANTVHFTGVRGSATAQTRQITISNAGGGTLGAVTCSAPASWLDCSVSGTTLTISADPSGLASSPLPGTVTVNAAGAANTPQTVTVTFEIGQPVLALGQSSTSFEATLGATLPTPTTRVVSVQNVGAGTLANLGTISCTPPSGSPITCAVNQFNGTITLGVNMNAITSGTTVHPVTVSASNTAAAQTLAVVLNVAGQAEIVFSQNPVTIAVASGSTTTVFRTVTVSNGGGGELGALTCTPNPAVWLTCTVSGNTLQLTANPGGLTVPPPAATVIVTAANIPNDPAALTVQLAIQQTLALNQSNLAFSASAGGQTSVPAGTQASPASAVIQVSNASGGTLQDLGTISCTPSAQVTCSVNQLAGQVTVSANPVGLPPGTYNLAVVISASNASNPTQVPIVLTVSP